MDEETHAALGKLRLEMAMLASATGLALAALADTAERRELLDLALTSSAGAGEAAGCGAIMDALRGGADRLLALRQSLQQPPPAPPP